MADSDPSAHLHDIHKKVDELIAAYRRLKTENQALKSEADQWQQERNRLLKQNELARNKIAEMIGRLRNLEQTPHE